MAHFIWTAPKRLAVTYLAMGRTESWVKTKLGIGGNQLERWKEAPEFGAMIDELATRHADVMRDLLEDAERQAVLTLMELTEAKDEDVRFKAAESLLNRAGKRGKPVEQVEQKSVSITGDMNRALDSALRDPGVLRKLQESGFMLPQLAAPSEAKPSEVSVSPQSIPEAEYEVINE